MIGTDARLFDFLARLEEDYRVRGEGFLYIELHSLIRDAADCIKDLKLELEKALATKRTTDDLKELESNDRSR